MARGRATGARRNFAFEKLRVFDENLFSSVKEEESETQKQPDLQLFGSDSDPEALKAARRNLAEAGVERWVRLEQSDVLQRTAPAPAGVMGMNPPHRARIGSAEGLAPFYP